MTASGDRGAGAPPEKVRHPLFARFYTRFAARAEELGVAEHRDDMLAGLSGRVVEVGAGTGLNFSHYPSTIDEVVAVEPEPLLREQAVQAAADAPVRITVVDGTAAALPLEDAACDAGVASLVLCSVRDQAEALAELRRVIRPGGELRFYEHVLAETRWHALTQRALDHTIWPRLMGGCHPARDTAAAIVAAGFDIERMERIRFAPVPGTPVSPHILGSARAPGIEQDHDVEQDQR